MDTNGRKGGKAFSGQRIFYRGGVFGKGAGDLSIFWGFGAENKFWGKIFLGGVLGGGKFFGNRLRQISSLLQRVGKNLQGAPQKKFFP